MKEFNIGSCKLEGCQLIEASAGTGKTFTITRIFLYLLLAGYSVSEVLLVSFTIAATKELGERIRHTLQEALALLQNCQVHTVESDISQLLKNYPQAEAYKRIEEALSNFDQVNVYTIHSFCKQILEEYSFESGLLPGHTISTANEDRSGREIILDFWRRHLQNAPRLFLEFLISLDFMVEKWCESFEYPISPAHWTLPVQTRQVITEGDLQKHIEKAEASFFTFRKFWQKQKTEALDFFTDLKKQSGRGKGTVEKVMEALEEHFQKEKLHLLAWDIEEKIFNLYQKKETHSQASLQNSFSEAWTSYREKYEALVYALRDHLFFHFSQLKENYSQELDQKRFSKSILSYQDLLSRAHRALHDPVKGGNLLRRLGKKKYRIAIIDEFQDTDRLQSEIFSKIFEQEKKGLFLIGDPKQSIYAFRGSDIHVYQEWKTKSPSCFGLFKNYRSSPRLLEAIHAIYTTHKSFPFSDPALEYHPTRSAPRKNEKSPNALRFLNADHPSEEIPLHFILFESEKEQSNQRDRTQKIQEWIAFEIKRLLALAEDARLYYKGRALRAEDIGILVRKGSEGLAMREVLQRHGITAILCTDQNVFDSQEALDLELVLAAIRERGRGTKLKAALSTELWGYNSSDIYEIFQSEEKKSEMLRRIRKYASTWENHGFTAMFRQWLYGENIHCSLLERSLGERRLSNVLHIAELIQLSKEKGALRALYYLRQEIQSAQGGGSAPEKLSSLRIESDRNAVQIMTVHVSKGLEFPVVFCPCLSQTTYRLAKQNLRYYDKEKKLQVYTLPFLKKILERPLGSHKLKAGLKASVKNGLDIEAIKESDYEESLAEELRVLYVALTRARERLYVCLAEQKPGSAAQYLFSGGTQDKSKEACTKPARKQGSADQGFIELKNHLSFLSQNYPQSVFLDKKDMQAKSEQVKRPMKKTEGKAEELKLRARTFQKERKVQTSLALHSFSSLNRQKKESDSVSHFYLYENEFFNKSQSGFAENRAREICEENVNGEVKTIFSFPKGMEAGLFFHEILENIMELALQKRIAFAELFAKPQNIKQITLRALKKYNYSPDWQACIAEHIAALFETPLLEERELSLKALKREECMTELAFYSHLEIGQSLKKRPIEKSKTLGEPDTRRGKISRQLSPSLQELWPKNQALYSRRFLRGFIDLVFAFRGRFYIIDWKSNFLGDQSEDYSREKIEENMQEHGYHLQYYIYADALHRFLKSRQAHYEYETHFGGVFYIYLRGIHPKQNTGIYFTRPTLEELQAFQDYTSGKE